MRSVSRIRIAAYALLLAVCTAPVALSQGFGSGVPTDLSGEWRKVTGEDVHERGGGPDPGEYWGLPVNDAARMRTDTYSAEWVGTSELLQCRPHPTGYQQLGPDPITIWKEKDPITRELIGYRVLFRETPGERMIFLDGRPRPSDYALRSWEGFSLGDWEGDTLVITTTHMKESFTRRNGVPASFHRTVVEYVSLDEPYLTWAIVNYDDDYLTEPLVRSVTYIRAPNQEVAAYPCSPQPEEYSLQDTKYRVPAYQPGENPYLTEVAVKYKVPLEGTRGGKETLVPSWRERGEKLPIPTEQYTLKPVYNDASTRVAERADAQPVMPPKYDKIEALHTNGNVYMLVGAGGNVAVSVGGDGIVMVDTGAPGATDKLLAAIPQTFDPPKPPVMRYSASQWANTWQITHSVAAPLIRTIINTSIDPDHTGGNEAVRKSSIFHPIGSQGDEEAAEVLLAHENVQRRMIQANAAPLSLPTVTYLKNRFRLHRYFNGEGVELMHFPNAHTDGDTAVWFRGSNVIATGDIYNSDTYPVIDIDKGGSVQGLIDALVKITDLCYPEYMSQGGTLVIPGHGWLSDAADIGYYRDMVVIIRDRVQAMIDKGMTLDQIKAAKPTMDYDPLYGRKHGSTAQFVEAVYRSLTEK